MERIQMVASKGIVFSVAWALFATACGDPESGGGEGRAEATIASFTADPQRLEAPGATTLSWATSRAASLTLLRDGVAFEQDEPLPSSGSLSITVEQTTSFELIAAGRKGAPASRSLTVEVEGPSIASFSAPAIVGRDELGVAKATFSWTGVYNATELVLEADTLDPLTLDPSAGPDGEVEVELFETTTFTLIARNPSREVSETATVQVVPFPAIDRLELARSRVGLGETVELQWETSGASRVELWADGVRFDDLEPSLVDGSHRWNAVADSTIELRAFNEVDAGVERQVEFVVAAPLILSFAEDPLGRWFGQPFTLSWESVGGTSATLFNHETEATICESDEPGQVDASSCAWEIPAPGEYFFTLSVENASGITAEDLRVAVGTGPIIRELSIHPADIDLGGEATIRWAALPDPSGELPSLELTDDRGETYPIAAAEGELQVQPDAAGNLNFTLEASTTHPLSLPAEATAGLRVWLEPVVHLDADPTYFDDQIDEAVTFTWTSENTASAVLYQIIPGSEPLELHHAAEEELASGTFTFTPADDATYRLIGTSGTGVSRQAEIEITLAPPAVIRFAADPVEALPGEPVTLSWTTSLAHDVSLDLFQTPYLQEESLEPYLDVEAMGGTYLPLGTDCSDATVPYPSCEILHFPPGFSFPFGGEQQTRARIYASGFISFTPDDLAIGGDYVRPQDFPTDPLTYYAYAHLAPFWELVGWPEEPAQGNIHYLHLQDPAGDALIIQWKAAATIVEGFFDQANVNFEVVLWENGDFEYRYGRMEQGSIPVAGWDSGATATIGYQSPDRSEFGMLHFSAETPFPGALQHRSIRFRRPPSLAGSGSFVWFPFPEAASLPVELRASRGDAEDRRTIVVDLVPRPAFDLVEVDESALIGAPFRIRWRTRHATAVEVLDAAGDRICFSDEEALVEEGFCDHSGATEAIHSYRVRAEGARGSFVEESVEVKVHEPFAIDFFTSDKEAVEPGEGLILSWLTTNAQRISLEANGVELLPRGAPSGQGLLSLPKIEDDTTFILRVTNSVGVRQEASVAVTLWRVQIEATASSTSLRPGEPFTVNLNAISLDGGAPPTVFGTLPFVEVQGEGSKFFDIAMNPNATLLNVSATLSDQVFEVPFPEGFTFPYFGEEQTVAYAFFRGYVSFTQGLRAQANNERLPVNTDQNLAGIHLAPFWEAVHPRRKANMWTMYVDDTFIIQWSQVALQYGVTTGTVSDMNYQVVLYRDGSFEYRYGTMAPAANGSDLDQVNGSSATIGYQNLTGTLGYTHHMGGAGRNDPPLTPYPGGLSNRTFRYTPFTGGTGQLSFVPVGTQDYAFCAMSGAAPVCRTFEVEAPFGVDEFSISPQVLEPGQSATIRWKTSGGSKLTLLQDGVSTPLVTSTTTTEIDEGSLTITPEANTSYTLELLGHANWTSAAASVEIVRVRMTASASATSALPGAPITLSWTLNNLAPDSTAPVVVAPMEERMDLPFSALDLTAQQGYIVLVGSGQAGTKPSHVFENGFRFNYFGREYDRVRVSSEGYLSFDTSSSTTASNQLIPSSATGARQLPVFWDDLHTRYAGQVLAKPLGTDRYVFQWSRMSLQYGSTDDNEGSLDFMVVLHANGDFEYRYGDMRPPREPMDAAACYPASCVNESNGASATIGYQSPGGTIGALLHFGGTNQAEAQQAVPGGLSHRSWKFTRTSTGGSVVVRPADTSRYELCAIDPPSGDIFCADPVEVEVDWGIRSFTASTSTFRRGDPVALSWDVTALERLVLRANGVEVRSYDAPSIPSTLTITEHPTETTTYSLEGISVGRKITVERLVELRTFDLSLRSPSGRIFPGDTITIDWELTPLESGPLALTNPMIEVPAGPGEAGEFRDIEDAVGRQTISLGSASNGHATVTLPFGFPYFGQTHREIQIYVDGYLSFDIQNVAGRPTNTALPSAEADGRIHLAPFWDDLYMRGPDQVVTLEEADTFIIQYAPFNRSAGSSPAVFYDLNFQVVLHRDGSFEYRYGTMAPPPPPFANSACFPATCELEANGSSATIGYQTPDRKGSTVHFGGQTATTVVPVPNGLGGRSFRFEPATTGAARLELQRSRVWEICGAAGSFVECRSVLLETVADPGDLMITEVMLDPGGGEQWFELRNLSQRIIDLEGFEIRSRGGSHRVSRSVPIAPGELITLAPTAASGFAPTYAYGAGLAFLPQQDSLEITAGTATIASVAWGFSWVVPKGETLALDPSFHQHGVASNDDFFRWCPGTPAGTPGVLDEGCLHPTYDVDLVSDLPFIDISTTGTRLQAAEGYRLLAPLPTATFSMPFFDQQVRDVWVSSNGWLSFSPTEPGGATAANPAALPRTAAAPAGPLVAAFWESLVCNPALFTCSLTFQEGEFHGEQMLIVQWTGFQRGTSPTAFSPGSATFQVQLWHDGTVVVATAELVSDEPAWSTGGQYYLGSAAWIGIEGAGRDHLSAHHRSIAELSHRAIRFFRR